MGSKNPLNDFNWISVPYCTGDVHLGANAIRFAGAYRNFNGHTNLALMMERAVATFPTLETLLVTGESAGGFGSVASYDFLRGHWTSANGNADLRAILLDDSGPVLDDTAIPVCLQERWRKTWNITAALPDDCACDGSKGNIGSVWAFNQKKWPKDSFGLVSSLDDGVISSFFAFGLLGCWNPFPFGYKRLAAGLQRLSASGVPVYMIDGDSHTHTTTNEFFTREVDKNLLYKWVAQLISSGPDPSSVMPAESGDADVITV